MNEDRKPLSGIGVRADVTISAENARRLENHYGEDVRDLRQGLWTRLRLAADRFRNDVRSATEDFSTELEYSLAQDGFRVEGPVLACQITTDGHRPVE